MKVKSESEVAQSCLTLVTPWTAAHQAPPSMGFSRQEYWSEVTLPSLAVDLRHALQGFPGGSEGKASACNAGNQGSIPASGRSPGEENSSPLQYPCLENPMDGEAW